ncbi:sigma-54 interaction domain-containing protein [Bradyrhizobium sp. GCM10027634]|uniref:sigma-54 interaction domain-containing protein n=1 Tax=unclassified Bradyrhizobium TaxID=2631580 RepID=UPI00188A7F19|nr:MULTISPECIES: sigma 54-interacting transcriptional regulator [unclassified Bradyrhizobium]MDN5002969.1 sigma 54-interacting transcriptional regulator [Bradyrhizobium sp. WYCCWR 12677]QOZ48415.1 sigma-54-dependent Fis family transcriptional regulator [Bradyrhizobium sp. CCBAU 53340]
MSTPSSVVSDPAYIRARAMETLFERLEHLCEGAIAIDRSGRVVYVNEKYVTAIGLSHESEALGRPIEEVIPNSLMRRVVETGEPIILDIMELGGQQLVVTRMPIEDEKGNVIGAIGFVLYDRLEGLKPLLARVTQLENDLRLARRQLSNARAARFTFNDYVGATAGIVQAKELAGRAARQNVTVLLTGETGTGKEMLAQAIHNASSRAEKPFVSVNVAAIPDTLIESEFFGTAPGAYTGADRKGREGKFRVADGGTLFLDEIGEMPLQLQAKLLRVLQEREIEPLGSDKISKVDVRVIAATNVDLHKRVSDGAFRPDLYYRLNVLSIDLPPLRDCLGDLPEISARLLEDISATGDYVSAKITSSALAALARYDWPGNVRELRNVLERALILSDSGRLTGDDFARILPVGTDSRPAPAARAAGIVVPYAEAEAEFEKQTLEQALAASNGQISEAAKMLRISRATFYKKLAKFGLTTGTAPV